MNKKMTDDEFQEYARSWLSNYAKGVTYGTFQAAFEDFTDSHKLGPADERYNRVIYIIKNFCDGGDHDEA